MLRTHHLLSLVVVLSACGDDGVHHLADAPEAPTDAMPDSPNAADPKIPLHIVVAGSGNGTVTSSPAGITCTASSCSADFDPNTVVTLTAVPGTGSVFAGWSGACAGTIPTCDVTLANAATVTATFDVARYAVTVTKSGAGTGVVAGNGLNCGVTCTMMVNHGTMLSLIATPGNLSVFAGWGGACSGAASCAVIVTGPTASSANFALDNLTLFVTKGGNGAGTVTATGIACGADCSETYTAGQMVTLTAAAATGSAFTGWSGGGCSGTATCTVTMTAAITVTAAFTLQQFALNVTRAGNGAGSVVSNPTGIACGGDCTETYDYNTMVVLTATPSTGSTFTGWSGACTGTTPCMVAMTAARNVTATFTLQQLALTVTTTGNGTVSSSPAGIACPADCSQSYNYGTMVTLTAAAATGSTFTGWGGACTGTGACTVTIDAAKSVSATFTLDIHTLTVTKAGTGGGIVTATGISCGADCSEIYNYGTAVTLTAAPTAGSTFVGWSGACTGTGTCNVTIDAAKSVTATFDIQTFTLTTSLTGNGTGTISSTPAGISCGVDCSQIYNFGTVVSLTASAGTGSTFTGWGGACAGTAACTVTMDAVKSVSASFILLQFPLTMTKAGAGSGTVTSSPAGISCGADCTESYLFNTPVTLTAAANPNTSDFAGWSGGGCSGTGTCSVTMSQAQTVTATFTLKQMTLRVTKRGDGSGTVSGNGLSCGATCSVSLPYGTLVTLSAAANTANATLSNFTGWSGAGCTTGPCSFTITANTSVDAAFKLQPNLIFVTSGLFNGNLGGIAGADAKCNAAASSKGLGGNYLAYISGATTVAPARFGGVSGWVRTDGKPVMNSIAEFGGAILFNPPSLDEGKIDLSNTNSVLVWTATKSDGTYFGQNCNANNQPPDWNSTQGRTTAGALNQTGPFVVNAAGQLCTVTLHLYCLGVDRRAVAQ